MANTQRRKDYIDRNGNMFIPMSIEGGVWNESFFTTTKLMTIGGIILVFFVLVFSLQADNGSWQQYLIVLSAWFIASFYLVRYVVFEEKFYYRMYKELQEHEISTPALFWDIASIKDTDEGAILTYSDAKVGILVKIERDTITGKSKDFKEVHYDAISDFYKEVVTNRYSFVQMNIMEKAGKDPRLNELSKIVNKSDNANICKLMEMQVGHIKNITRASLYESDYFLFYTSDVSKVDTIIQDISECIFKLLDGAYIGYQILTSKEVVDLVKELYGVNYFNSTEASLMMFDKTVAQNIIPFNITGVVWQDSYEQEFNNQEKSKLRNITSKVIRETLSVKNMTLKKALYRRDDKKNIGVDFSMIENIPKQQKEKQQKTEMNRQQAMQRQQPKVNNTRINIEKAQQNNTKVNLDKQQSVISAEDNDNEYIDF